MRVRTLSSSFDAFGCVAMFDMAASYCVASIREIAGTHEVQYKTPLGVSNYIVGHQQYVIPRGTSRNVRAQ